jgi:hypothetical protein
MIRKQILIALGMAAAMVVCLIVAARALGHGDAAPLEIADRLALAAR